jgi:adenylate kinase/phosphoserine phosphatase
MQNNYRIGIYGISGSGKSTLIKNLCEQSSRFQSFEGSKIMEKILNDDISNFKLLDADEKYKTRVDVIKHIKNELDDNMYTIVDGHYSFIKNNADFEIAITKEDLEFYTHIFHLDISDEIIKKQQLNDKSKQRNFSIEEIRKWKEYEKIGLQEICKNNNISFYNLTSHDLNVDYIHEVINKENLLNDLNKHIDNSTVKKYILFDADYTIVNFDTGKDYMYKSLNIDLVNVKSCFKKDGYCFSSFFKLSKLHSKIDDDIFVNTMHKEASKIEIETDFLNLLKTYSSEYNICIVTAGFTILWQEVLKKYNLENIKVFGGNNLNIDNYIIDNNLKGYIASYLQKNDNHVISFGDSLLDKDMLINSNKGFFVIREKERNDVISELSNHQHIKYLSIHSLDTNDLVKTSFTEIIEELN